MARLTQKKKALLEALKQSMGVVTTACRAVGVERKTFYNYLNSDPNFREEVDNLENVALDFAESKLFKQIKEDNLGAIIFYLKCKGKKRGYVEKQEVDVKGLKVTFDKSDEQL